MTIFQRLFALFCPYNYDDAALSEFFDKDPWGLACAHMAYWRTDGMTMGFDLWWSCADANYMREIREIFPRISEHRVKEFLRAFAQAHQGQTYQHVMQEASMRSGVPIRIVLGPGESMTIEMQVPMERLIRGQAVTVDMDDCVVTKHERTS